jgi:hypothetical protein
MLRVPSLADQVVLLRRWREADVPAQLAAFSDPFFLRFSDWAPRTEADARAYSRRTSRRGAAASRSSSRSSSRTTSASCSAAAR